MRLYLVEGWIGKDRQILADPLEHQISALIRSLDWQQFNSVRLERDSKNWIDVSGNLGKDGLAIVYEVDGVQFISNEAPSAIAELEEALVSFFRRANRFQNSGFTRSKDDKPTFKHETTYEFWKIRFDAKQKLERSNYFFAVLATAVIMILIGSIIYFWSTDDLKFVGYKTDIAIAVVKETKRKPMNGKIIQQVTYEFIFKGCPYRGYFRETKFIRKYQVGDLVKIKFAVDEPSISKRVATLKRK